MAGHPYPGYVYEFWGDDNRCLYVGKAGAGPSGPALRLKSHYETGKPWAIEARWIRVTPMPVGTSDAGVLWMERQRIQQLRPRGNRQHNGRHHDAVWAQRVHVQSLRSAGVRVPLRLLVSGWRASVRVRVASAGRVTGWMVAGAVCVEVLRNAT